MKKILIAIALVSLLAMAPAPPKVTICHFGETMDVPLPALDAHLAHGDYLGACVDPTPTPTPEPTDTPTEPPEPTITPTNTPTPEPDSTDTPEPTAEESTFEVVIPKMYLLVSWNDWQYRDCIIISDTHPSVERQNALCFPWLEHDWKAHWTPCAGPVYSMFEGDDDGYWKCDQYTPWRLPLETLRKIYNG